MVHIKITNKEYSQLMNAIFFNEDTKELAHKIMRTKRTLSK